jgi:hypothetical protein
MDSSMGNTSAQLGSTLSHTVSYIRFNRNKFGVIVSELFSVRGLRQFVT